MKIDKKAINYYHSFFEVSKDLTQKQFYDFNMAIYKVMFFETHIEEVSFKDQMLTILWKSVKHSIRASVDGYCTKKSIPYDDVFAPLDKPLANKEKSKDKENEQVQEKEKGEVTIVTNKTLSEKTIDYLNLKASKKFTYTKGNIKEINSQIKKGYGEDAFAFVIDIKCKEWLSDSDMNKNLNPVTLFREANFDRYLNQQVIPTKQEQKEIKGNQLVINAMRKRGYTDEQIREELAL